jgi:signal peptidase I
MLDANTPMMKLESVATSEALATPGANLATRSPRLNLAGQWVLIAVLALACYWAISHFLVQSVKVVGVSMAPTLSDSHRYLLNRWVLHVRSPRLSDVVVLRDPTDNGLSVKRIIATAGDSVAVKQGNVYVNGRKLDESYLVSGTHTYAPPNQKEQSFQLGKDQVFVLGDNRNYSVDSRTYGPVPQKAILGLVVR